MVPSTAKVEPHAEQRTRLDFVDVLRGIAVVFMIPLHTSHGWVAPALRSGNAWAAIQFFGGLAAPLFLSLSGVSLGLRWGARAEKQALPRHRDDLARALQLVVLGYGLRLQMWIIDGSGYAKPYAYVGELLLLGGYGLAYFSLPKLARAEPRARLLLAAASAMVAGGLVHVDFAASSRLYGLLRVDVLQCIGGSLAIITVIGALRGARFARPGLYVGLGVATAFATAWTRSWVPGPLPSGMAAYLGQWEPTDGRSVLALFPLFPWLAYALIGTALGLRWQRDAREQQLPLTLIACTALGACLSLSSSEALPHIWAVLHYVPWLVQPVRVMYRIGLVLVLTGLAFGIARLAPRSPLRAALDTLGRASLLVYWVHLEFAFGAAAASFKKTLDYTHWALGSLSLLLAMVVLAQLRVTLPAVWSRVMGPPRAVSPGS